jgi:hypothetical protein
MRSASKPRASLAKPHRSRHAVPRKDDTKDVSAARLAAEAFFSNAPPPTDVAAAPAVVIRKRRTIVLDAANPQLKPASSNQLETDHPKVFRVSAPLPIAASVAEPAWMPAPLESPDVEGVVRRRRRRLRDDQRPSPAVVIRQIEEAEMLEERAADPEQRMALQASMQSMDKVLADVEHMRSLTFTVEPLTREWTRLSTWADDLLSELREAGRRLQLPSFIA